MDYPNFAYKITHRDGRAKRGEIHTPHGVIETPAFIFCATKAAMRVATPQAMKEANTQIILGNTYHLMLQPGADVVAAHGGLHKFMGWDGPMLTDSGGFQIFSLGHGIVADEIKRKSSGKYPKTMLKIDEEGAVFRSYIDGAKKTLTPESAMQIQRKIGADIVLVLDECTPFNVDKAYTENSMELSHRWAARSLKQFEREHDGAQSLYGIVQGGVYPDLRQRSADFLNDQPFFGQAVGGVLGDHKDQMYEITGWCMDALRDDRPTHLLGIGGLRDMWEGVALGIDTFDCVHPTRLARHGSALYPCKGENLPLRKKVYELDKRPIQEDCGCYTCQNFSRGYLHHLVRSGEPLGGVLLAIHNAYFMNRLMTQIRESIEEGRFAAAKAAYLAALETPAGEC